MAFKKQGTPQPFKIACVMCEICGKKYGKFLVKDKLICEDCKVQNEQQTEREEKNV